MTAFALVNIAGTQFTANPVLMTFADPSTPLYITYQFPSVTLTSLTPLQTLLFVKLSKQGVNQDWDHHWRRFRAGKY
jgi:hypothetical protein